MPTKKKSSARKTTGGSARRPASSRAGADPAHDGRNHDRQGQEGGDSDSRRDARASEAPAFDRERDAEWGRQQDHAPGEERADERGAGGPRPHGRDLPT